MKRIFLCLIIFQSIFIIGCNQVSETDQATAVAESEEETPEVRVIESEGGIERTKDDSIYKTLEKAFALTDKEEVIIRKINKEKYLVGFQEKFEYQMNPIFHIYDLSSNESIQVDGVLDYINEIRIVDKYIDFYSKGTNIINGFKRFPNITEVDLTTGQINNRTVYSSLGYDYKPYYLGNFMNETKLKDIKTSKQSIALDFSVSENSILAGGDHCPNIEIVSEDKNTITVDIENLIIDQEVINSGVANDAFEDLTISYYIDGRDIEHSVLVFEIKDYEKYTCTFVTEADGIKDLVIGLK